MIPDGEYVAVVAQLEDDLATLEVSDTDELYSLVVDEEELPQDARHSDAVLHVTVLDGNLVDATYDDAETEERKERAQSRFDRLSKRPPNNDDE